ncbi:hypothetical protein D3C85_1944290 [compost metagenome]
MPAACVFGDGIVILVVLVATAVGSCSEEEENIERTKKPNAIPVTTAPATDVAIRIHGVFDDLA